MHTEQSSLPAHEMHQNRQTRNCRHQNSRLRVQTGQDVKLQSDIQVRVVIWKERPTRCSFAIVLASSPGSSMKRQRRLGRGRLQQTCAHTNDTTKKILSDVFTKLHQLEDLLPLEIRVAELVTSPFRPPLRKLGQWVAGSLLASSYHHWRPACKRMQ